MAVVEVWLREEEEEDFGTQPLLWALPLILLCGSGPLKGELPRADPTLLDLQLLFSRGPQLSPEQRAAALLSNRRHEARGQIKQLCSEEHTNEFCSFYRQVKA